MRQWGASANSECLLLTAASTSLPLACPFLFSMCADSARSSLCWGKPSSVPSPLCIRILGSAAKLPSSGALSLFCLGVGFHPSSSQGRQSNIWEQQGLFQPLQCHANSKPEIEPKPLISLRKRGLLSSRSWRFMMGSYLLTDMPCFSQGI